MLSKNQVKLITSLHQKKYRNQHGLFIVEGPKALDEFLNSKFKCQFLFCTDDFLKSKFVENTIIISDNELKKISALKNPNKAIGVFKIPDQEPFKSEGLILTLDEVSDPGNLGTIIRLCDWFGVEQIICSSNTVDCYNPKVVQASMGSLTRVSLIYTDLRDYLTKTDMPIYGALMQGENIYEVKLPSKAILVMGNEANGISKDIIELIRQKITIPSFGKFQQIESLNVATATAILLNEFRRV
ncbi:MAG: RNA methyltransferase [Flavobacteriaceae bacterium]|nr:RNA methyltransferase [Flavobacteriaceae bacterium]